MEDTLRGLKAEQKYLESKYFYDESGDELFREIMNCEDYYLTRCELEIFMQQREALVQAMYDRFHSFDVVELGAGDCSKSVYLLDALMGHNPRFTYFPIDISANTIAQVDTRVKARVPNIKIQGLNGDYFDMLDEMKRLSSRFKVVLFLGSSIGNIPLEHTVEFFKELHTHLLPGDLLLTGFDLVKDPQTILAAYNDRSGITRRFNLNLLDRINKSLGADFDTNNFEHSPVYCSDTQACKSYLESLADQTVQIAGESISFQKGERIYMEVSQKYTVEQTDEIATAAGFQPLQHFYDSKMWFLDALWQIPPRR